MISPSLAEGARGWVDTTSTLQVKLAIASKYSTSVITKETSASPCFTKEAKRLSKETALRLFSKETTASPCFASERSEQRNNSQNQTRLTQKMDCHANSLRSFARNDGKVASNDKSLNSPSFSTSGGNQISSPSLAEGARGWVNPTSAFQTKSATAIKGSTSSLRASRKTCVAIYKSIESVVIASERSERGKTRRSRSFFSNPQKNIDCHENPCGFSRNDESFHASTNAKDTHPQTPLALRKVVLREAKRPCLTFCAKPQYDLQNKLSITDCICSIFVGYGYCYMNTTPMRVESL